MDNYSFEERLLYSQRLNTRYPDYVPVIIKKSDNDKTPTESYHKYLMPKKTKFSELIFIIRKKLDLNPKEAIFIFAKDTLIPMNNTVGEVYDFYKSDDNFLYIIYRTENTFG